MQMPLADGRFTLEELEDSKPIIFDSTSLASLPNNCFAVSYFPWGSNFGNQATRLLCPFCARMFQTQSAFLDHTSRFGKPGTDPYENKKNSPKCKRMDLQLAHRMRDFKFVLNTTTPLVVIPVMVAVSQVKPNPSQQRKRASPKRKKAES